MATEASENVFPKIIGSEQGSDPATPSSGQRKFYAKDDGWYDIDDAGTVTGPLGTGGGAVGGATVVPKTANESVTSSATLQDDDDLLLAVAENEVWEFEVVLWYEAHTSGDLKVGFTVPTGATLRWTPSGLNDAGTAWNESGVFDASGAGSFFGNGAGSARTARVHGVIINGANAGNLQLQWAQNASNGTATTVYANSALKAWQLA